MSYDFSTVPNFTITECSSGSVDILEYKDHFILYNNGDIWMIFNKNSDKEIKELYYSYDIAHGDVLVSGLGFGILALWLCSKPEVHSVTVIEISEDVIKLFKDANVVPEKLKIINDNMIIYCTEKKYDVLLLDHYEQQEFDFRIKDIEKIANRINHNYVWAWSLEEIFMDKAYKDTKSISMLDFYNNIINDERFFVDTWNDFTNTYFPKTLSINDASTENIRDYINNYFNKDSHKQIDTPKF
jgi:hypothetical protein